MNSSVSTVCFICLQTTLPKSTTTANCNQSFDQSRELACLFTLFVKSDTLSFTGKPLPIFFRPFSRLLNLAVQNKHAESVSRTHALRHVQFLCISLRGKRCFGIWQKMGFILFRSSIGPSATKSGRPYGVMYMPSCGPPPPTRLTPLALHVT